MEKAKAIIYSSKTGHTKKYAELLSESLSIPCYDIKDKKSLEKGANIIYMGWLMAGTVNGYKKAAKIFNIIAVCGVGMSTYETQKAEMIKKNSIPDTQKAFCLAGGLEPEKLTGILKFAMGLAKKGIIKDLSGKENLKPEDEKILKILVDGGNSACKENLSEIIKCFKKGE